MLKVFTYLNEILPALWNLTRFSYIFIGVEPVGRPSTKYLKKGLVNITPTNVISFGLCVILIRPGIEISNPLQHIFCCPFANNIRIIQNYKTHPCIDATRQNTQNNETQITQEVSQ